MKVLLADDDVELLDLMAYALRREGFTVIGATDGQQALARWQDFDPDLVLLDGNMPRVDGFEVCRRIRHDSKVPIIMLTVRNEEDDVVRGLDMGADDYVTKPFSSRQLAARMRALLRRARTDTYRMPAAELRAGNLVLDLDSHQVTRSGEVIQLTPLEFRILHLLMMNQGRVIPYARLVDYGWGYYDETSLSLLKTHVSHLRSKLELPARGPGAIRSLLGVGYCLSKEPVTARAAGLAGRADGSCGSDGAAVA